jgi:small subunit ribosomal protein S17
MSGEAQGRRKTAIGVVTGDRMDKTIVVAVERKYKHPKYEKYVRTKKKYYAHDERDDAKVGDRVLIEEARPLSRLKRWRLREVMERAVTR